MPAGTPAEARRDAVPLDPLDAGCDAEYKGYLRDDLFSFYQRVKPGVLLVLLDMCVPGFRGGELRMSAGVYVWKRLGMRGSAAASLAALRARPLTTQPAWAALTTDPAVATPHVPAAHACRSAIEFAINHVSAGARSAHGWTSSATGAR